jgi:hypothetical protein
MFISSYRPAKTHQFLVKNSGNCCRKRVSKFWIASAQTMTTPTILSAALEVTVEYTKI